MIRHTVNPQHAAAQPMHPQSLPMHPQVRVYFPYVSPFDPCPPILEKTFSTPPQLFLSFQPPNLPQFNRHEALRLGTLWPALYSSYRSQSSSGKG